MTTIAINEIINARYIKVTNNDPTNGYVIVPELEVYNFNDENIALNKPTTASSIYNDRLPEYMVDGNVGQIMGQAGGSGPGNVMSETLKWETGDPQFIQVDLGATINIKKIKVIQRTDWEGHINENFKLEIIDDNLNVVKTESLNYTNFIEYTYNEQPPLALTSISMENIINPNTTGTLTITFNQSIGEANLNANVTLNPTYIGTIGDITSANGGVTYTGTITLNEGINRINNKVNLSYNGITGEASYDVVESNGISITNQVLEKEYKDDTITKRYVAKISPDGSHVGVIDLRAAYDTLSTIIYEYDSNTNDYIQKGSVLKTGYKIEFTNGNRVLIGAFNGTDSKWFYYKYDINTNDWEIIRENIGGAKKDVSIDGLGKRIASSSGGLKVHEYDEVNNTFTETNIGGVNIKYVNLSNDGNVLYVATHSLEMKRYNYDGTNWTLVYHKTINGINISELNSAGINNLGNIAKYNVSNDGKIIAVTSSQGHKPGATDINGTVTNHVNITIVLEYDEVANDFSAKGNIINHTNLGLWVSKSVDITGDGQRIIVGDTGMKHINNSTSELEGKVEIYDYNSVTNNWDLYNTILGGGGVKDNFGDNVSVTSDGTKITGTNHNHYTGTNYGNKNYNTNDNIIQEYSRIYSLEKGIERRILSMSMNDTSIKFPETGTTFEVKYSTNEKTIGEVQGGLTLEPITAGTLTNVTMGNNGFSIVGTYNAATQTETTGNKLKYSEGELSAEVEFILSTAEKAISNICFRGESKVLTSEGYMEIQKVKKGMKIQGEEIEEVTRTISKEKEVVLMKKGSIMKNMPKEDTVITKEHKVLYKGEMVEAKKLVNGTTVVYEKYKGETLYNIMLSGEGKMVVNGMIVETLSPSNNISKLYKIMKEYKEEEKQEIIKVYNEERKKKNR